MKELSHRQNLTIKFVLLTMMIYVLLLAVGLFLFKQEMTSSIDNQLDTLISELNQAVYFDGWRITLNKPYQLIKEQPFGRLARVQLYSRFGDLVEQHGIKGRDHLILTTEELSDGDLKLRSKSVVLSTDKERNIGYLQVQIPTTLRDKALNNYMLSMGIVTLFALVLLSAAGYLYSKDAARPLELSYELLKRFSADAAHELGTPIATILASAQNLRSHRNDLEKFERRLGAIERAGNRISKLVDDLMLLTRLGIEAEVNRESAVIVNVEEVIDEIVTEFEPRYQEKSVALELECSKNCLVKGYKDNLLRLFDNLLENSLKYTESAGVVKISAKVAYGYVEIVVSDTGIGIPEDCLEKVFERFYRVDRDRSRVVGGSGLGLSIVKAIVEKHEGRIELTSNLQEGSVFKIYIPVSG